MDGERRLSGRLIKAPENFLGVDAVRTVLTEAARGRRDFIRAAFAAAGAVVAAPRALAAANPAGPGDPNILQLPEHSKGLGQGVATEGYGKPSKHEADVQRRRSPGLTQTARSSVSFRDIATKYAGRADALDHLAGKARAGSVGAWGGRPRCRRRGSTKPMPEPSRNGWSMVLAGDDHVSLVAAPRIHGLSLPGDLDPMSLSKREFFQVLGAASAAGMGLGRYADADAATAQKGLYDSAPFGNVSFLHMTDCHAQLQPVYFREPSVNIGVGALQGHLPHRVGQHWLKAAGVRPGSSLAHAFTSLDFEKAARRYGRIGGFAHLATLVKQLRASRPGALLLDGGDTWQGSATALWTNAQDMVEAAKLLGVDVMTGHWEFTYGMERVKEIVENDFKGRVDFLAQNIKTADFGDPVFKPWVMREINGVPCAIIGQAFPYTPIANPRYLVADWSFGIQEENLQKVVEQARAQGAQVVVLLSHNGMDVDLKMASRVRGIDAIFGGHTHDGVPLAVPVANAGGQTLVTNAGSNTKFLGVMDFDVKGGRVADFRYRLLPVFANQLAPDAEMQALIKKLRQPFEARLSEKLAVTDGLLYRRGNFNGSWDQLICDALMEVQGAEIAFSPGFRWGTSLLPGDTITRELMMDQLAITYPYATLNDLSGEAIKRILEDVADNLFNPDPYYQQGGDMVRVGGLAYSCDPAQKMGGRISGMRLHGKPIEAGKTYRVAGWAPVAEEARAAPGVKPVWEHVETWLAAQGGRVRPRAVNLPTLLGVKGNPGLG